MSIYDEYVRHTNEQKALYGENTLVLFEVGTFLEIYGCGTEGADVARVCETLNITATRRNKGIAEVSRTNPDMGGVPRAAIHKYLPLLLSAGTTVVLVSQTSPPPRVVRAVTRVFSKSTYDPEVSGDDTAPLTQRAGPLMAVVVRRHGKRSFAVGWATVDITTGATSAGDTDGSGGGDNDVCTNADHASDMNLAVATIVRSVDPAELVVTSVDACADVEAIVAACGMHRRDIIVQRHPRVTNAAEEEEVIRAVFPSRGMLSGVTYLGLGGMATTAFVSAVKYVSDHDERIIKRLRRPEQANGRNSHATLSHDALKQLDFDGQGGLVELLCNGAVTPAGKRMLRARIRDPICDVTELDRRLDLVDELMSHEVALGAVRKGMCATGDLERYFRRVAMQTVTAQWVRKTLLPALEAASRTFSACPPWATCDAHESVRDLGEMLDRAVDGRERRAFTQGFRRSLDELTLTVDELDAELELVVSELNKEAGAEHFRVIAVSDTPSVQSAPIHSSQNTACISTTSKRLSGLKARSSATLQVYGKSVLLSDIHSCDEIHGGRHVQVLRHPELDRLGMERSSASASLDIAERDEWVAFLVGIYDEFEEQLNCVTETLAEVDVAVACAWNATRMRHVRPALRRTTTREGSIVVRGLRHPLIETLRHDTAYVPNDIALEPDGDTRGALLYGVNASGKTSLMKSVGIATLMAQAGMFVACDAMELAPYESINTRMGSTDDILRGHSTFVHEMLALRDILRRAAHGGALVIGDELCSGTESVSALSIVAATIATLHDARASFVFATHLHALVDVPVVANLIPSVRVSHLSVRFENVLVYDRVLKPGRGDPVYGLEVASGLDMPRPFLLIANSCRRLLMGVGPLVPSKRSAYNRRVPMGPCSICGTVAVPRETHHIRPQAAADRSGFIGHFHQNRAFNLAVLCAACHDDVHAGRVNIVGTIDTSDGVKLSRVVAN